MSHFTDKEVEAQRGAVTCPESQSEASGEDKHPEFSSITSSEPSLLPEGVTVCVPHSPCGTDVALPQFGMCCLAPLFPAGTCSKSSQTSFP